MTTKSSLSRLIWLLLLYVGGNIAAYIVSKNLVSASFGFIWLVPMAFLLVPFALMILGKQWRLYDKGCSHRESAVGLVVLGFLTWMAVLYIFLQNVFPEIF